MTTFFYELRVSIPENHAERYRLIPLLQAMGFEGFLEEVDEIIGYAPVASFQERREDEILAEVQTLLSWPCRLDILEDRNWNAIWESDYEPVIVDNTCMIRALFHSKIPGIQYDILIEPRMSFGTAHHETTYQMIALLLQSKVKGTRVLDMGSGTAVLAILAEKLGAREVWAIDNDTWAFENALDNLRNNNCTRVEAILGDAAKITGEYFDIILANINRNILLEDIPSYSKSLQKNGLLFLSGFYEEDLTLISDACARIGMKLDRYTVKNRWLAAIFKTS